MHRALGSSRRAQYQKVRDTQRRVPKLARVGFLVQRADQHMIPQMKELRLAAVALKLKLEE